MQKLIQKIIIISAVLFAADISFAAVINRSGCTVAEFAARNAVLRRDLANAEKLYHVEYQAANRAKEAFVKFESTRLDERFGTNTNLIKNAVLDFNIRVERIGNVRTERRRNAYRKYDASLQNCTGGVVPQVSKTAKAESPAPATEIAAEVKPETAAEVKTETESAATESETESAATESAATESASSSGGGGSGAAIGAGVAVVGAAAMLLSGGDLSLFNFAPDFRHSAVGGRMDFRKDKWHLYYSADSDFHRNGNTDFRYKSGGEYKTDLFAAAFSESVNGKTADYDFSLSANLQNGIWKISPVYRLHSEYENGKTETRNELNLQGVLQINRWTISPSAGFRWENADNSADNARFQINAVHRF